MKVIWEKDDGEFPKGCVNCLFIIYDVMELTPFDPRKVKSRCIAKATPNRSDSEIPNIDNRPDWCPLITTDELLRITASPFRDWESED